VRDAAIRKARESAELIARFVEAEGERIAGCARALAERLRAGGTLFTAGNGGSACDALHAAVEFSHPIVERRRGFPAHALPADPALLTAIGNDADFARVFSDPLRLRAREGDALLALSTSGRSPNVVRALQVARERGLLGIALTGKDGGRLPQLADHCFVVPSHSIHRIQEVHVVLLHVLWDLVHVALGEEDVL
jgi:D-sedoheptulose 7-phosphate isomerase